jgi:hypothetical protein
MQALRDAVREIIGAPTIVLDPIASFTVSTHGADCG